MSTQWVVELSNGEIVYQDDTYGSSWIKLRNRLIEHEETGDSIVDMHLRFRSHVEKSLPRNAAGYFFVNQSISVSISKKIINFYLIGHVVDGIILVQRWKVPELLFVDLHIRKIKEVNPLCLIGIR